MATDKTNNQIEPTSWYTLNEIAKGAYLFGLRSPTTVKKIIDSDIKKGNIMGTVVAGRGNGKRYLVLGANITKFIKTVNKKY